MKLAQPTEVQKKLEAAKPKVFEQRDRILERGPQVQRDILEFYLDVYDFKTTRIENVPKWVIAGYMNWESFQKKICSLTNQSRASFYQHMRMVESLPPATIKKLGKSKAFMAARLKRRKKLTPEIEEKLEKASVEQAKSITRKAIGKTKDEHRIRFHIDLRESQWNLLDQQVNRIRELGGEGAFESALDQLLAYLVQMTDEQIGELCRGQVVA